jgi:Protein of unknown function (DUF1569)
MGLGHTRPRTNSLPCNSNLRDSLVGSSHHNDEVLQDREYDDNGRWLRWPLGEGLNMKNLFDAATATEIKERIGRLGPGSVRQWGKMSAAQAMAHCATTMEWAVGDNLPPRMFVGRLLGPLVKSKVLKDEAPMRRNAPTAKSLVVADDRDLAKECQRLCALIDRFSVGGPPGCTKHPHAFFGRLTPDEWSQLMYKHLDHHLRQFGA